MNKDYLEPAASIIGKIGVSKISKIIGKHESRVYRWRMPKEKGGTGGTVPISDAQCLLDASISEGWGLSPSDFFQ